ncbi:MAG: sporulation protein YqfD [Eubacteriales bacterium]|nr:sporulation protein YqfD [Eubacteriales bacterium]
MYRSLFHFLQGSVLLRIESPSPERVLNLCGVHGITFWSLRWLDETTFTLRTTRRDVHRLKQAVRSVACTISVERERGAPAFLRRFRKRYVLLTGVIVFGVLLLCGHIFIWDFEVQGNETIPTETILRALEDYGVGVGTLSLSIDQEDLRNHVLLELHDVSWMAVNVRGCTAHVQVVERHRPPPIVCDAERSNVVARCAGLVTRVEALGGRAQVMVGTTVTQGQLLISGVADFDAMGVRLSHGMGKVWARTWHELSVSVPLQITEKENERKKVTYVALDLGKQRIKICGKGSITGDECDKIIRYKPWTLPGGYRLPVTLVTETVTQYDTAAYKRSVDEAQQEGEAELLQALEEMLAEDAAVEQTKFSVLPQGDRLQVLLSAECLEQIGEIAPIEVEEQGN